MKYNKSKILIGVIIAIFIIIATGQYILNKDSGPNSTPEQIPEEVKKGNITQTISASGQIATANYLAVTTSVNGIVKKVYVKEGDTVKKGDKLMDITLDSEGELSLANAYSAYLRAKNSITSAQNSLHLLETTMMQKEDAFETEKKHNSYQSSEERLRFKVAESEYLNAKNNFEAKKSDIHQLQIALNSALNEYQSQSPTITASANGVIANIVAVEGTKISNSVSERSVQTVASIRQEGTPIASVNISELDINKVKTGQKVNMTLNSFSDKSFTGMVAGIDKLGSVSSGVTNYTVIIKFNENSDLVLPNMGVEANIIIDEAKDVVYVPTASITTRNGKSSVQQRIGNSSRLTQVELGLSDGSITEIKSGLKEGDIVMMDTFATSGFANSSTQNRVGGSFGVFTGSVRR